MGCALVMRSQLPFVLGTGLASNEVRSNYYREFHKEGRAYFGTISFGAINFPWRVVLCGLSDCR